MQNECAYSVGIDKISDNVWGWTTHTLITVSVTVVPYFNCKYMYCYITRIRLGHRATTHATIHIYKCKGHSPMARRPAMSSSPFKSQRGKALKEVGTKTPHMHGNHASLTACRRRAMDALQATRGRW